MNFPVLSRPRRLFDLENWFDTTLDVFDPFDELDLELCHDVHWIRQPILHEKPKKPIVPYRYRFLIDSHGYKPDSINIDIEDDKLVVNGYDEIRDGDDFSKVEFRKSFQLPYNLDKNKMICFITKRGQIIAEIPFKKNVYNQELEPEIQQNSDGSGIIKFKMDVKGHDLTSLKITIKDLDLIISFEDNLGEVKLSRIFKLHLPDNIDQHSLTCIYENNELTIEGYMKKEPVGVKKIPIYSSSEAITSPGTGPIHIPQEHMTSVHVIPPKIKEEKPSPESHTKTEHEYLKSLSQPGVSTTAKDLIKKISLKTSISYPSGSSSGSFEEKKSAELTPEVIQPSLKEEDKIETITEPKRKLSSAEVTELLFPKTLEKPSVID